MTGTETPTAVAITRLDRGPRIVIEDAPRLALTYFDWDTGAKRFDAAAAKRDEANTFSRADLTAVNSLLARSPESAWLGILDLPCPELALIDPEADLLRLDDAAWDAVLPEVNAALKRFIGPHRGLATATKALHLKRPRLFPILDALVVDLIGGRGASPTDLIGHVRAIGRTSAEGLEAAQVALREAGVIRSDVRVLDALLWSMHPGASIARHLDALIYRVAWQ